MRGIQPPIGETDPENLRSIEEIIMTLGIDLGSSGDRLIESLPFSLNDTTAGSESELQTAVVGRRRDVDLPLTIERSNYYANIIRRATAGETPRRIVTDLESYLGDNPGMVWENSWVRFPMKVLSPLAREMLDGDFLADKRNPDGGPRADVNRFTFYEYGEKHLRLPISYLIKLALADAMGCRPDLPEIIRCTGARLLGHFSNDNTSPETFSFHVVPLRSESGMGRAIAKETAKRFLMTQLLTLYANVSFKLRSRGQEAVIYSAPNPPVRQRVLNDCISDAFYRELFMSPCLSGWDRGEDKHRYMCLCHQVLSRSQLNGVAKLREAGIITRNLVVLPNMSNTSLANNGIHLSLGSVRLSRALEDSSSGFTRKDEKIIGDLAIKIVEHFLPLFVGTYSAAPYRLDFPDFHPEKALGFLPHELDFTHLRMIWRRWKKKASIKVLGRPVTPFGPEWLDRAMSALFGLKGDFVPDFRLIDYFAALMSTDRSPALDGRLGNGLRLKQDLADLGVFDEKMALYLLYRLREFHVMGFSGFEGRHYSLFESLESDMGRAADLQTLVNALAFKYIAKGEITHVHIPDTPSVESERRQIFFGAAIGIPTFYVRKGTANLFLRRVIANCERVRHSRRYPGYLRVYNLEYRRALVRILREEASDLIGMFNMDETLQDLTARIEHPDERSAAGKLTGSILDELGARSPMEAGAGEFNAAAEGYYRDTLRKKHMDEAFSFLEEDARALDSECEPDTRSYRDALSFTLQGRSMREFLRAAREEVMESTASAEEVKSLIDLLLITIHRDIRRAESTLNETPPDERDQASVRRAAHW
jgi:hypothetical protein